ncbi:hypothetical protein [Thiorhodovibrio frisius]|uniref:Uncharacterized protein n=1 Tax=Thiorhodovibrio frisius TaxID=631362 RepID=H8Z0M6_9GAMM|nr:hypothetical protein [Thiorhodovibrio frisius]EIC22367.1 hypothetical protein Thi970DRAFT_02623 [Thiorhodovibrio frisius]WPL24666.1 hypothetical protein Thiofri_04886 [Thiorhodovibrio frisius]
MRRQHAAVGLNGDRERCKGRELRVFGYAPECHLDRRTSALTGALIMNFGIGEQMICGGDGLLRGRGNDAQRLVVGVLMQLIAPACAASHNVRYRTDTGGR